MIFKWIREFMDVAAPVPAVSHFANTLELQLKIAQRRWARKYRDDLQRRGKEARLTKLVRIRSERSR